MTCAVSVSHRDKWLFKSSVVHPPDAQEVANPSELFARDPFDFDSSDPETQARRF